MKIAIITGASSGLGRAYALAAAKICPEIDCFWLIARRADRLKELADKLPKGKARPISLDLTDEGALAEFSELLRREKPEIDLLINNAGYGKLGDFADQDADAQAGMVRLNCEALTRLTSLSLPYMKKGGKILMTCSIAAFAPTPRMAVYCSTKAYAMSFARALRFELKPRGIQVCAVCPGPMDTEFLTVANIPGRSKTFQLLPRVRPDAVAEGSLRAAARGRAVYTNRVVYKIYRVLAKILPHCLVIPLAKC